LPPAAELRGRAEVAVVQAADFWERHDLARRGERDRPEVGGVLVEREVGARLMVISEVCVQRRQTCSVGGSPPGQEPEAP
jgi:hypothetical protein